MICHGGPTAHADAAARPRDRSSSRSAGSASSTSTTAAAPATDASTGGCLRRTLGRRSTGEDCVAAARYLAAEGEADPARTLAIEGGSAGGYVVFCALVFDPTAFAAGVSYFGVADAEALARDTHKFESRYLDCADRAVSRAARISTASARRPLRRPARAPMLLLQGLDDEVVPPSQAEAMVAVLERKGIPHAYLAFEGEGHGFRKQENVRRSLEATLSFVGQVFGFDRRRRARAARAHVCALKIGVCVGWSAPPARSTVAATTAPFGTSASGTIVVDPLLVKRPALCGMPPAGITQASYVWPDGAACRLRTIEHAASRWIDRERAVAAAQRDPLASFGSASTWAIACALAREARARSSECESDAAQIPRPMAAQAATLAAAAVERMSHGRRMGSDTTFSRSAAAVVRIRSRRRAGGGGRYDREREARSRLAEARELLAAARALGEMRLVGLALLVARARRARRRRSGRGAASMLSSPGSPSSSRSRASPVNMRLLIVPSGSPSRSASSDCVKPP